MQIEYYIKAGMGLGWMSRSEDDTDNYVGCLVNYHFICFMSY